MDKQDYEVTIEGLTMGCSYSVKYVWQAEHKLMPPEKLKQGIEFLLEEVNRQMSVFRPDSEISHFNRAPAHCDMAISAEFAQVLQEAIVLHQVTAGGLDVSIGALFNLWGFGPNKPQRAPERKAIAAALQTCGMDKLIYTGGKTHTLRKTDAALQLTLSSIAKGFGVDKIAAYLNSQGIENYMVEIGGELHIKGKNVIGKNWRIAIEDPSSHQANLVLELSNIALATSGDYKKFYQEQSDTYTHTIHPQTGQAQRQRLASLSVLAQTTMRADGIATGLFVQGEEKAWQIAQEQQLAVMLLIRQANGGYKRRMTDSFAAYLANE